MLIKSSFAVVLLSQLVLGEERPGVIPTNNREDAEVLSSSSSQSAKTTSHASSSSTVSRNNNILRTSINSDSEVDNDVASITDSSSGWKIVSTSSNSTKKHSTLSTKHSNTTTTSNSSDITDTDSGITDTDSLTTSRELNLKVAGGSSSSSKKKKKKSSSASISSHGGAASGKQFAFAGGNKDLKWIQGTAFGALGAVIAIGLL